MHLHIIGVCGTFMAGIATIARSAGHTVTGCDQNVYPPMSTQLERLGIDIVQGYDPAQLDPAPDIVVIGNAMSRGNTLVEAVLELGLPYTSGPQWLANEVLAGQHVIAVSGTHGKTTTASMLAWMLESAGVNPGFLIGGVAGNFDVTARKGDGRYFVIEADEYDTAFFDKRAKFVHYRPRTLLINNIEFDHADIYADTDAILWQFHQLLRTVPGGGRVIVNGADARIDTLLTQGCWTEVERFGLNSDDRWTASFIDAGQRRLQIGDGQQVCTGTWEQSGEHNLENALAATAAARSAGVSLADAVASIASFAGVKRRLERTATVAGVAIYDDFAHHPTAIRRTIDGLRKRNPGQRIVVALEPRSNTMKMGFHKEQLAESLQGADLVFVCRTTDMPEAFDHSLAALGDKLHLADDYDSLVGRLRAAARDGDHLVFMSNGAFGAARQRLTTELRGANAADEQRN